MTISIDEYRARVRKSEVGQERMRELRASVHEAVRATAVTGDANWDHFLAKIEGRIKTYRGALEAEQRVLCHPSTVNQDKIMEAKIKIVALESAVQALEEIIDLPRALIHAGLESQERLKAIGEQTT